MDKSWIKEFYDIAGVTLAAAIASLLGGFAGLALAKNVTPRQAIWIVLSGIGTGSFGSAGLIGYFALNPVLAAPLSFFLGVLAMPILGLAFGLVSRWRDRAPNLADRIADAKLGKEDTKPPETP